MQIHIYDKVSAVEWVGLDGEAREDKVVVQQDELLLVDPTHAAEYWRPEQVISGEGEVPEETE